MSASSSGTAVQFTPLQGAAATTANATVLKVAQAEPQLSRTYYQDGRLLTALDLNRDYAYLDRRLLDLGLALGDGVIQGLVASLTGGTTISVTEGRGVASSGRVIAYTSTPIPGNPLSVNLSDMGTLITLNGPTFSGISDGLVRRGPAAWSAIEWHRGAVPAQPEQLAGDPRVDPGHRGDCARRPDAADSRGHAIPGPRTAGGTVRQRTEPAVPAVRQHRPRCCRDGAGAADLVRSRVAAASAARHRRYYRGHG